MSQTGQREMLHTFRGILNKLTSQTFEALMKCVDELSLDTEERLKEVILLITEKAALDQSYSMLYARLCHYMKGLTVRSQSGSGFTTFHRLLLRKCQREFQKNELRKEQEGEMAAAQNEAECQQQQTKGRAHERYLGIIRFIGELFNLKMVTEPVVNSCIVTLIKDEHTFSLECLCKLLSTVGQGLDTEAERPNLNKYFGHLCHLIKERKTSMRVRCLLMDVYNLRKNNWVPRGQEEVPKDNKVPEVVKKVGPAEQRQLRGEQSQAGERDAVRVAHQEEKSSSKPCSSSTPQSPPKKSCLRPSNAKARKEKKTVSFLDEQTQTSSMTVDCRDKSKPSDGETEFERGPSEPIQDLELVVKEDRDEGAVYETLKRLLQANQSNNDVGAWIQDNLNIKQRSSEVLIRALMRSVGESLIVSCGVHKVDALKMLQRAGLLKTFIVSEQQQLEALNVLQELMVSMEHPRCLLRMFCDLMLDQDIIQDTTFFKWESSTDSQTLASVSNFFAFLRMAKGQLSCI